MAGHRCEDIRNFAIVGHASSGKTILSEAMLACSGAINRMGRILDGTTVSDYHVSEKQRQVSTQTSLLHTKWMDKKFNIMDTPGYLDFMSEALAALRVADFALVVVHAQHGIGVGAIEHRARERADRIEREAQRECAVGRHALLRWLEADNAVEGGGPHHRAERLGAKRQRENSRGHSCRGT